MAGDPERILEKATENLAGGLAQLKHLRFHMRDDIPADKIEKIDLVLAKLEPVVNEVALLEVK